MNDQKRTIGILLFDDVEELDAVGPWEVLAHWCIEHPEDGWTVTTLSADGNQVTAAKGMVLGVQHSLESAPKLDVLIHPGGMGTRPLLRTAEHLDWVRRLEAEGTMMTSVCTGSLVYAAAGLLANRPATTHWQQIELLGRLDPTIQVRVSDRFVDDGDVVTSAGVSAGIDMALHLVSRFVGVERAVEVKDGIQYDPLPPV